MKAIRFEGRRILPVDIPVPDVKPGEALVRVSMAGICGTDIAIFNGYTHFEGVPGHEFAGVVEKCPDRPELIGKKVVADINIGCGACSDERHCPKRRVLGIRGHNGAFAEYLAVPAINLHPVPERLETRHAVFTELLAAALEISQQIHIHYHDRIAVLGDGPLGILVAAGLRQYSGGVVIAGRHPEKLAIAEKQGVKTFLLKKNTTPEDLLSQLGRFDITVDATGSPQGINWCIPLTRPEGTVAVKTTTSEKSGIDLSAVVVNELNLMGSRCGDMALALDFLETQRVHVEPLIEAVYPFVEFEAAFSHAMKKGSRKVLLAMPG